MKTLILLSLMQLASAGADAYYTNRDLHTGVGAVEHNPIARPFVKSPGGCAAYFSVSAGLHIGGAFLLHKHHHDKLAWVVLGEGIADNSSSAGLSASR